MPKLPKGFKSKVKKPEPSKVKCKACQDTGIASNGAVCVPCQMKRRMKP